MYITKKDIHILRGPALAFVGCRGPALACVGCCLGDGLGPGHGCSHRDPHPNPRTPGPVTRSGLADPCHSLLTDEHENQMLHLLGRELARSSEGEGIYIAETFFMPSLIMAHKEPDRANQYATASGYNWLRKKGQDFGTGILNKLATITNVGGNNWVAVVIDFRLSQILGDSLGGIIT